MNGKTVFEFYTKLSNILIAPQHRHRSCCNTQSRFLSERSNFTAITGRRYVELDNTDQHPRMSLIRVS